MNLEILPFKQEYVNSLLKIFDQNVPEYFDQSERDDFAHYLKEETELYYVATLEGEIVGCGGINYAKSDKNAAVISWDMIAPQHHGIGIGKQLLLDRIDMLKKQEGINKIIVRTSQHTYIFYQKMGFELLYTKKDYWAPGIDLYNMEMNI
ncbi:MAG: GNAT family N-acetyltransferase [Bacteroidia bacterium]